MRGCAYNGGKGWWGERNEVQQSCHGSWWVSGLLSNLQNSHILKQILYVLGDSDDADEKSVAS